MGRLKKFIGLIIYSKIEEEQDNNYYKLAYLYAVLEISMFFLLNSTFIFTILFGADIDIMAIIPDLFNIGIGEGSSFFERWVLFGLFSVSPILLIMYSLFPFKYVTNINFTVNEIERAILFYTIFKYSALVLALIMGYVLSKGISIF